MSSIVSRMRGTTLMEIMIVLVLIGILTAIAYPNYRQFSARAERTATQALLLEIASRQERFYLNANRFGTLTELGYADPLLTDRGSYTVTIPRNDASDFIVTANYNDSDGESDRCSSFSIDSRGNRISAGSKDSCWTDQR
jgi:type IV pilus assembly protein PilE